MPIIRPIVAKPYYNYNQLRPASYYAHPALPALTFNVGANVRQNVSQYEYTLKQMAASPFSVNSEAYMDRIRKEYGFSDNGMYDALGTIGGVVGAGAAAYINSGIKFTYKEGFKLPTSLTDTKAISRRNSLRGIIYPYSQDQIKKINEFNKYTKLKNTNINTRVGAADELSKAKQILDDALKEKERVKYWRKDHPTRIAIDEKYAEASIDYAKKEAADQVAKEALEQSSKSVDDAAKTLTDAGVKVSDDVLKTGSEIPTKLSGMLPGVGTAIDIASLGFSSAGFVQEIKNGNPLGIILSGVEVLGDTAAVIGDFIPGVGELISDVGTLVSTAMSAIRIGMHIGTTVGHSLTPEGARAQELFTKNLYAGMSNRPVSTVTAATIQFAVPAMLSVASRGMDSSNTFVKLASTIPYTLTNNVLGNQVRAGLTMGTTQMVLPAAAKLDEKLPWHNAEEADFVSAISLFGDIQDNIYGATRNKAILLGLASKDSSSMEAAIGRAWGYTDEPAYVLTASDIIKETPLNKAPVFVQSILGVAGEILFDPRNLNEVYQTKIVRKRTELATDFTIKEFKRLNIASVVQDMEGSPKITLSESLKKLFAKDGMFKDPDNINTQRVIAGAIQAYGSGNVKALETYFRKIAINKFKGIEVRFLNDDAIKTQANIFKNFLDEVYTGTYKNNIVNNIDTVSLAQAIKNQHKIVTDFETNKILPSNVTQEQYQQYVRFLSLLKNRYNTQDYDTILVKLVEDFNLEPSVAHIKNYYKTSDAFMAYMDATDDVNKYLVAAANPIGKVVQMSGPKLIQNFNDWTRSGAVSEKKRARVLVGYKNIADKLDIIVKSDEIKGIINNKTSIDEQLNNIKNNLSKEEGLLLDDIIKEANDDPEFTKLEQDYRNNVDTFDTLIDQLKTKITDIESNRSNFKMRDFTYTHKNVSITVTDDNREALYERYKYLDKLMASKNPSDYSEQKNTESEYRALKTAFMDFELVMSNNETYQKVVASYKTVIGVLNSVNSRLEDHMMNVLLSLHVFKQYTNMLVPKDTVKVFEARISRVKVQRDEVKESIKEQKSKITEANKSLDELYKTWGKDKDANIKREELTKDSPYSILKKEISAAEKAILGYEAKDKELVALQDKRKADLTKLKADIKSGKKDPEFLTRVFSAESYKDILKVLDDIQAVNLLNGLEFTIVYKDENGVEQTKVLNKKGDLSSTVYRVRDINGEISRVGLRFKDNFTMQVNKLMNYYLNDDIFSALSNYDHKLFDLTKSDWRKMSAKERKLTLTAYIENAPITEVQKEKLLDTKTMRAMYLKLDGAMRSKGDYTFVPINKLSTEQVYRYVMQEQFKIYKGNDKLEDSKNPIIQAFVQAANELKMIDDMLAELKTDIDDVGLADVLKNARESMEVNLRNTPVYKYIKNYLYDYIDHDKNKLTLFARSSVSELLPDSIDKYKTKGAKYSIDRADSIVDNVIEAPLVKFILEEEDIVKLRESIDKDNNIIHVAPEEDLSELTLKELEERKLQEAEQTTQKDQVSKDRIAHKEEVQNAHNNTAINPNKINDMNQQDVTTSLSEPLNILPMFQSKNTEIELFNSLSSAFNLQNNIIGTEYFKVSLHMRELVKKGTGGQKTSFYTFLKNSNRSTVEYEQEVDTFAYKLAWMIHTYGSHLKLDTNKKFKTVEEMQAYIKEQYLNKHNIAIRVSYPDKQRQYQASVEYTNIFRNAMITEVWYHLKHNLKQADATRTDAEAYINDLRKDGYDKIKMAEFMKFAKLAQEAANNRLRSFRSLVFAKSLYAAIYDLRKFELDTKESISKLNPQVTASLRKHALVRSQEVKTLFNDLKNVSKGNKEGYQHIFFKLLNLMNTSITEDYRTKQTLRKYTDYVLSERDGELIFTYVSSSGKKTEYTVFDLLFIHRLGKDDYTRLVNTAVDKTGAKIAVELISRAQAEYTNVLNEHKGFITNNTLQISKEVFMSQLTDYDDNQKEELYKLFTDPNVIELTQRLRLIDRVLKKDSDGPIDPKKVYDARIASVLYHVRNSFQNPETKKLVFTVKEKDSNKSKELFSIDKYDADGIQRSMDTLFLLTLLELSKRDDDVLMKSSKDKEYQNLPNTEHIKHIIKTLFFYDLSSARGKASNTNIEKYNERIKELKDSLNGLPTGRRANANDERARKHIESSIRNTEAIRDHYKAMYDKFDTPLNDGFDKFYEIVKNDSKLAELYYNSVYDSDDPDKFLIVEYKGKLVNIRTSEFRKYREARQKDINEPEGIVELNDYLVNYVINKNSKANNDKVQSNLTQPKSKQGWDIFFEDHYATKIREENKKLPAKEQLSESALIKYLDKVKKESIPIVTADGAAVLVVPDKSWQNIMNNTNVRNQLRNLMNAGGGDNYVVNEVYVLSTQKYAEIQKLEELYGSTGGYPMTHLYKVEDYKDENGNDVKINVMPGVLNVKGNKAIIGAYMSDLDLIGKQKNIGKTLDKLKKYYANIDKITPVYASYNEGVELFNTSTFKNMQKNAVLNMMFFDFYEHIGDDNINLEYVGKYFNKKYINPKYDLETLKDEDPVAHAQMSKHKLSDGRSMYDHLLETLKYMQKTYGNQDLSGVVYSKVFDKDATNDLVRLQRIVYKSLSYLERTNKKAYKMILPEIQKHLDNMLGEDVTVDHVMSQQQVHMQIGKALYDSLNSVFKDPFKTFKTNDIVDIFNKTSYSKYQDNYSISNLQMFQYNAKLVKDYYKAIKTNHENRLKRHKNSSMNFMSFVTLRSLYNNVQKGTITREQFYEQINKIMPMDKETVAYFDALSKEIFDKAPKDAKFRKNYNSAESIKNHIIYGFAVKAYLISINQYMNRNIYNYRAYQAHVLMLGQMQSSLIQAINNKADSAVIKQMEQNLNDAMKGPYKDVKYKINDKHFLYYGTQTSDLYSFNIANRYDSESKITSYILYYIHDQFGYDVDLTEVDSLVNASDKVISNVTDALYTSKSTISKQVELPELPTGYIKIKDIEKQMEDEGFEKKDIKLVTSYATQYREEKVYTEDPKRLSELMDPANIDNDKFNKFVQELVNVRKENAKLAKASKDLDLNPEEITQVLGMDILEHSVDFLDYFANVIRNNDRTTDIDDIYKTFKRLGLSKEVINRLLSGGYENIHHFLADHNLRLKHSTAANIKTNANLLILFINYHKMQFIKNKFDGMDLTNPTKVAELIRFDKIREKQNTKKLQTIKMSDVFGYGRGHTTGALFKLNQGFSIIASVDKDVNYANDRIRSIIVDDNMNTQYTSEYQYITYTKNNVERIATEIQHILYEPMFKEYEAGSVGARKYQYALERQEYVQDMIAEQNANSYDEVGSSNIVFYDIRKNYTHLLKHVKLNFADPEFVRVRDVSSGILVLSHNTQLAKYYSDYFEGLIERGRAAYITNNSDTGKSIDELTKEYDSQLDMLFKQLDDMYKERTSLVHMDKQSIKSIVGYIYTQRFETPEYAKELSTHLNDFIVRQLSADIKYKQYRRGVVDTTIRNILFDSSTDDETKQELFAKIHGKSFKDLTDEEQKNIKFAINNYHLMKGRYFNQARWYDTFAVARGLKDLDGANTTVTGKLLLRKGLEIESKKRSVAGLKRAYTRTTNNIYSNEIQNALFAMNGLNPYGHSIDDQILLNRAYKTVDDITYELDILEKDLRINEHEFKKRKINILKKLFVLFPDLHDYYRTKAIDSKKIERDKIITKITTLNKNTNQNVQDAYTKSLEIRNEQDAIKETKSYIAMKAYRKIINEFIATGANKDEVIELIFTEHKTSLEEIGIKTKEELLAIYDNSSESSARWFELEKLYKKRGVGIEYTSEASYLKYERTIEAYQKDLDEIDGEIDELNQAMLNDKSNWDDLVEIFDDIVKNYNEEGKKERQQLFKDIKERKPVRQLTANEIKSILKHYQNNYNQQYAYLKKAFEFTRVYNSEFGNASNLDTIKDYYTVNSDGKLQLNKDIPLDKLIKVLNKETAILKTNLESLKNKEIKNIPLYKALPELEGNMPLKVSIYNSIALSLTVKHKEAVLGRTLSASEIESERNYLNNKFKNLEGNSAVVGRYTYIKTFLEYANHYSPNTHTFGTEMYNINLDQFKDPDVAAYIGQLMSNINNMMMTNYNKVVASKVKDITAQLEGTDKNTQAIELNKNILDSTKRKNPSKDKQQTKKLLIEFIKETTGATPDKPIEDRTLNDVLSIVLAKKYTLKGFTIKNKIDALEDQIKKLNDYISSIEGLADRDAKIRLAEDELKDLQQKEVEIQQEHEKYLHTENTKHGEKLNNLSLFKTYYELDGKTDEEILNKVLELSTKNSKTYTIESLKKFIEDRGEFELHNSTVDALITDLIYQHQASNVDPDGTKEHVVVDIETFKYNNIDRPYQMTMLYRDKEGQLAIHEVFINNAIFYGVREDGSYDEALQHFYEDQKAIWSKAWIEQWEKDGYKYTDKDIEDRARPKMDALIKRVSAVRNNSTFIEAFMDIVNPANDFKVIAHNGNRFDFAILENFIISTGEHLLINEYYRNIKTDTSLATITERIDNENLGVDEYTDAYIKELENELEKHRHALEQQQTNLSMTIHELDIRKNAIQAINNQLIKLRITQHVNKASMNIGYIVSDDIKRSILSTTNGVMKNLTDLISDYTNSTDSSTRLNLRDSVIALFMKGVGTNDTEALRIVSKYVDDLLKNIEKTYGEYINGTRLIKTQRTNYSVKAAAIETLARKHNIKVYDQHVPLVEVLHIINTNTYFNNKVNTMEELRKLYEDNKKVTVNDLLQYITNNSADFKDVDSFKAAVVGAADALGDDVKETLDRINLIIENNTNVIEMLSKRATSKDIVHKLTNRKDTIKGKLDALEKSVALLKNKEGLLEKNREQIFKRILTQARHIHNATSQLHKSLNRVLNNTNINITSSDMGNDYLNTLVNQSKLNQARIEKLLKQLKAIADVLKVNNATKEDIKKTIESSLDVRVLEVIDNPNKINEIKQLIQKDLAEFKADNLDTDGAKTIMTKLFNDMRTEHITIRDGYIKDFLQSLKAVKNINGMPKKIINKIVTSIKESNIDQDALKDLYDVLTSDQDFFNKHQKVLTALIKNTSKLYKTLLFLNVDTLDKLLANADYKNLYAKKLSVYREGLENSLKFLDAYTTKDMSSITEDLVAATYTSIMREIGFEEDIVEDIKHNTILSLIHGSIPSHLMTDEQYRKKAATRLNIDEVNATSKATAKLNLGVLYDNPHKADDIVGVRLQYDKIFGKPLPFGTTDDDGNLNPSYMFSIFDTVYNKPQQVVIGASGKLKFTFNWPYIEKQHTYAQGTSKESVQTKIMYIDPKSEKDINRLKNFMNTFYWRNSKDSKSDSVIIDGMSKDRFLFEYGSDSGKNAIDILIKFVLNRSNLALIKQGKVADLYQKNQVLRHEDWGINDKHVTVVNITRRIEELVFKKLAMLNSIERSQVNIAKLYTGVYNSVTSRYNALEPGTLVNMISPEWSTDYNLKNADPLFLAKHNIDLSKSSENSVVTSLKQKDRFGIKLPFIMSVNPVRTMLAVQHLYARFTTTKFLNDLYRDIPDEVAPGKKLLETFINDDNLKYVTDQTVRNRMLRTNKYNKHVEIFMPNTLTPSMYREYKADSVMHQFGVVEEIAAAPDPRIPLDTLAIDADYAAAIQGTEGDKTWLGIHYGFKGAPIIIQGLYEMYGANYVTHSDSVANRGAAGLYAEMMLGYIKSYLTDEVDGFGKSTLPDHLRPFYKRLDPLFRSLFKTNLDIDKPTPESQALQEGVLMFDDKAVHGYITSINAALLEYKTELSSKKKLTVSEAAQLKMLNKYNQEDTLYNVLVTQTFKQRETELGKPLSKKSVKAYVRHNDYTYDDFQDNVTIRDKISYEDVSLNTDNGDFIRGYIYVYQDHEHSTSAMQTIAQTNTEGNIVYTIKDSQDSVDHGSTISPVIMYSLIPKLGEDTLFKLFPPNFKNVERLTQVRVEGFVNYVNNLLGIEDDKDIDANALYEKLDELKRKQEIHIYIYDQAVQYITLLNNRNSEPTYSKYVEKELTKLVDATENKIIDKLYNGKNSALYRAYFNKVDGIRQQYLEDVSLRLGEVVVSKTAWDYIVSKNSPSNKLISTEEIANDVKQQYIDTIKEYKHKEHVYNFLNERGIFKDTNEDLWKAIEESDDPTKINYNKFKYIQTYAYVLGARSPVQEVDGVPALKIIGYSKTDAAKVNPYAYVMMGADNDGDTFAMALLQIQHVEGKDALLRDIDATKPEYYSFDHKVEEDEDGITHVYSYPEEVTKEQFGSNDAGRVNIKDGVYSFGTIEPLSFDYTRNYSGKRTNLTGRKDFTHIEMFNVLDPTILKKLLKLESRVEQKEPTTIADIRRYVNVYIRINNSGKDETKDFAVKDYGKYNKVTKAWGNTDKLVAYYNDHKAAIDKLYVIEQGIIQNKYTYGKDIALSNNKHIELYAKEFTKEQQAILRNSKHAEHNKYMKQLIEYALYQAAMTNTVGRVRVSKNGVNYSGGKDKIMKVQSVMSRYKHINKSKKGYFWKQLGAYNKDTGLLTFRSLLIALLGLDKDVDLKKYLNSTKGYFTSVETLKAYIDNNTTNQVVKDRDTKLTYYFQDYDEILEDIVAIVNYYFTAPVELTNLRQLIMAGDKNTVKNVSDYITKSTKKDDVVLKTYNEHFKKLIKEGKGSQTVSHTFILEIVAKYFSDISAAKRFIKGAYSSKEAANSLLEETIIERLFDSKLSFEKTRIIAVAKHYGLDQDSQKAYEDYKLSVDKLAELAGTRKINLGTGVRHTMATVINSDKRVNEKLNIKSKGVTNSTINKEWFEDPTHNLTNLKVRYADAKEAQNDIRFIIRDDAKMVLKGNMAVPNALYEAIISNLKILNDAMSIRKDTIRINKKDVEQAILFFNRQGISFFKLAKWIERSLSTKLTIASKYYEATGSALSTKNIEVFQHINNIHKFATLWGDQDWKKTFNKTYAKENLIRNFFSNAQQLDDMMYFVNDDGEVVPKTMEDVDLEDLANLYSPEQTQTAVGQASKTSSTLTLADFEKSSLPRVHKEFKEALDYNTLDTEITTYKNELNRIRKELSLLLKVRDAIDDKYLESQKEIKSHNFKTSTQTILDTPKVRDLITYDLIADRMRTITTDNNQYLEDQEEIKRLNKEIFDKTKEMNILDKQLKDIERHIKKFGSTENLSDTLSNTNKELMNKQIEQKRVALEKALSDHIGGGVLFLRNPDGLGLKDATINKPKYLTEKDLKDYSNNARLALSNKITLLRNVLPNNPTDADFKELLKFINQEHLDYRFVMLVPPDKDEGLYKDILSSVRKYDPELDEVLFPEKSKSLTKWDKLTAEYGLTDNSKYTELKFNTLQELDEWKGKVVFNGKVYDRIDPSVVLANHKNLSPTIKEVVVKTIDDLKEMYKHQLDNGSITGFVDTNDWMTVMETVYNPYKLEGKFGRFWFKMQIMSKNISKFSGSFLFRNMYDTIYQLFTNEMVSPKSSNARKYTHLTMTSMELYGWYKKLSEEHTILLTYAGQTYEDLLKLSKAKVLDTQAINKKLEVLEGILQSYVDISQTIVDSTRITYKAEIAVNLLNKLKVLKAVDITKGFKILLDTVNFISDMQFGDFVELYDNRVINGKWTAGIRMDAYDMNNNVIKHKQLNELIKDYDWKKHLLKQLSYFMNTQATNDYLRQNRKELLPTVFKNYRGEDTDPKITHTYAEIKDRLDEAKGGFMRNLNPVNWYNSINEYIENGARITNFFFNLERYNTTLDQAVLDSLHHWFNYGQRSPLEQRLMADIPFISFPVRSVQNWVDRSVNPKYWRFMADFIDGWYGQYLDEEDKEYDDYMKFQIANGWLPLGRNFGIRVGNGAFDIMNILYNTEQTIEQRRSPLLKGIQKFIETKDAVEALKQLATAGLLTRTLNTFVGTTDLFLNANAREDLAQSTTASKVLETRPATLGNTYRGIFYDINEYDEYTPYRYRYPNNGRWARYENIYKDWFNKYGRMRKPTVDPLSLVKDTQWKQYLNYRRSRRIRLGY